MGFQVHMTLNNTLLRPLYLLHFPIWVSECWPRPSQPMLTGEVYTESTQALFGQRSQWLLWLKKTPVTKLDKLLCFWPTWNIYSVDKPYKLSRKDPLFFSGVLCRNTPTIPLFSQLNSEQLPTQCSPETSSGNAR